VADKDASIAPGMEPLMQRRQRTVLPPKRPGDAPSAADTRSGMQAAAPHEASGPTPPAPTPVPAKRQSSAGRPAESAAKGADESLGDARAMVNLNIRVRQGIDDRVATCAFGLREFGLRNVSKAELVELAIAEGPLPPKATAELAERLEKFRARFPRP
jgi:hypothetical protein